MSFEPHIISDDDNNENDNSITAYNRHGECFKSIAYFTSSVVNYIRQLHIDLFAQHKQNKHALTELNQRLRLFINRVQLLESQNSKYAAQIADFRQQLSNAFDIQWNKRYHYLQFDLATINNSKVDYIFDFKLFQLQIGIYRELIDVEQQWKDERHLKLEHELKQLASALVTLRASYAELEQKNESLYAAREDIFKQYQRLTHDWCSAKKQRKKWDLNVQMLKSQVIFYKNLHSYLVQISESLSVESVDVKQFRSLEQDKCLKKIRRDFELLYAAIYREMTSYYEMKMEETQTDVELAVHYQQIVIKELARIQQALQIECEKMQKRFSYEQEIQIKLEAMYSKLESELKSIQLRHEEQFEAQSKELHSARDSIMTMTYNIDEMRRSKNNLEIEIIVYRHLLDSSEIQEEVTIASQPGGSEVAERFIVESESKRKGSVGFKECAASGKYISLMNQSTNKDIDVSRWVLKRRIDSAAELLYTLPEGVLLQTGKELIIYSKLGADAARSSSNNCVASSLSHQELVSTNVDSWGMGNTIQTFLFNENGEEEASHTLAIVFERNNL